MELECARSGLSDTTNTRWSKTPEGRYGSHHRRLSGEEGHPQAYGEDTYCRSVRQVHEEGEGRLETDVGGSGTQTRLCGIWSCWVMCLAQSRLLSRHNNHDRTPQTCFLPCSDIAMENERSHLRRRRETEEPEDCPNSNHDQRRRRWILRFETRIYGSFFFFGHFLDEDSSFTPYLWFLLVALCPLECYRTVIPSLSPRRSEAGVIASTVNPQRSEPL